MATSSGLFLAATYNQSQLAEREHVTCYWSMNAAATAVPLSAHHSPLVITTKLAAAILGGRLFEGGVLPAQYCPCGRACVSSQVRCCQMTSAKIHYGFAAAAADMLNDALMARNAVSNINASALEHLTTDTSLKLDITASQRMRASFRLNA